MRYHAFLVYPGCSVNDIILNYLPLGISQPCDVIDVKETLYYFQLFFSIFLQGNRKKRNETQHAATGALVLFLVARF